MNNLVTLREPFGKFESTNDFFNFTFDARLKRQIRLGGGFDTGRSLADNCFVVDSPQDLLYCHVVTPFKAQTQFKLNGVVPIKYDFIASFAFQNVSGPNYNATYTALPAELTPILGRPFQGTSANIPLVAPQTLFEDRITRLDLRVGKSIRLSSRIRLQANLDAYNALNSSAIKALTSTFGANWKRPTQILDPRIFQVSGSLSF